jgi:uncharacterized C2H2 Zn-finger protein
MATITNLKEIRKKFKCPDCNTAFSSAGWLEQHVEKNHKDLIPDSVTVRQYLFNRRNKKNKGTCVICQHEVPWNEQLGRYPRMCGSESCKKEATHRADENLLKKTGQTKTERMSNPEVQTKMLNSRGISGVYKFSDGKSTIPYVGEYELDFLEFFDREMGLKADLITESPTVFDYYFDGKKSFYIPDFYMPDHRLFIEIKDGGDNPNNHPKIQEVDKKKERLKDHAIIASREYNYIKIVNKDYRAFIELMRDLRDRPINTLDDGNQIVIISA